MDHLTTLASDTLRSLTAMPGSAGVVHRDLVHHVVGDLTLAAAVIVELTRAGHARGVDEHHIELTTIMQPASDSLPGYRRLIEWFATRTTMADETTQPGSFRLSPFYDAPGQLFESAEHAVNWFREHISRLDAMLDAAYDQCWYDLVLQLAEPMWSLYRLTGDHENELATQVLSLSAAVHLPEEQRARHLAVCASRAAYALSSQQRHDEAIREAEQAVENARQADEPQILSIALSIRGRAFQFAGRRFEAMRFYRDALALAERLDDPRSLALRHRRIGELLVELNDVSAAISHHEKAANLMMLAGDVVGLARVTTFLSRAHLADGEPASAFEALRPLLKNLENTGCDYWEADANEVLGRAAEHADPTGETALPYYTTAIAKFETGGEPERAERLRERVEQLTA